MRPANEAILVIDVQNDFCPGGALAVAGGDEIVAPINALVPEFPVRVFTQDWHPADHLSFASQHAAEPFTTTGRYTGREIDLGAYSRNREVNTDSSMSVHG